MPYRSDKALPSVSKINDGQPWPIGSTISEKGVNFSVAAPQALKVSLLIFRFPNDKSPCQIIDLEKNNRSGDYWHVEVEGLTAGACYGYEVINENNKDDPSKQPLLIDPCSRSIYGWENYKRFNYDELDLEKDYKKDKNYLQYLKSCVCERNFFDFKNYPRPRHSWHKTVIYELHVGGFTKSQDSEISRSKKGTYLGLIEKLPYLKELGITTLELLPVFAFDPDDSPKGVSNYWGYSPINWFTPHIEYVVDKDPNCARNEFIKLVQECHKLDLEVILDVVYNHTTEGNEKGPTISWKGFGDSTYYHKSKEQEYLDVSGCGNSIAANNPITRHLIVESLKCWANELGVDGFRFDLGIALSRGKNLKPLERPPLFEEIENDPQLSQLKLISEPWDCGGLYSLSNFPAEKIRTWNGKFRDEIRKFWRGDRDCAWGVKDKLIGSPSIYKKTGKTPNFSINFITSHDGYTLNDLVSFNSKHNFSNGENNRDGDNNNHSCNYGVEGPTSNTATEAIRNKQKRNLMASLLLSHGVPMILMGDETGRTQGGNNNVWCQDSPLGWMQWGNNCCDFELKEFIIKLLKIRKTFSELFCPNEYLNDDLLDEEKLWIKWHGIKLGEPDWGDWSHTLGYCFNKPHEGTISWIGINAYDQAMNFELPKALSPWLKVLDTRKSSPSNNEQDFYENIKNQNNIQLESKSFVLLIAESYFKKNSL